MVRSRECERVADESKWIADAIWALVVQRPVAMPNNNATELFESWVRG